MRVLALDTTTRAGSVALVDDRRLIAERAGDSTRSHAERLPTDLLNLLAEAGLTLTDVDLFAVAAGPGSFTGLRTGIATIQGLALVSRKRIVPVSILDALAQTAGQARREGALVAAWMDAHRGEVFSALYRVTGALAFTPARLIELEAPAVGDPDTVLRRWAALHGEIDAFIGDGATVFSDRLGDPRRVIAPPPLAGAIGLMAVARARAGDTVGPAGVQPLYVRRPDAEVDREKRGAAPHG